MVQEMVDYQQWIPLKLFSLMCGLSQMTINVYCKQGLIKCKKVENKMYPYFKYLVHRSALDVVHELVHARTTKAKNKTNTLRESIDVVIQQWNDLRKQGITAQRAAIQLASKYNVSSRTILRLMKGLNNG